MLPTQRPSRQLPSVVRSEPFALGAAPQHVVVADEAGHERVRWRVVQVLRRGELLDAPVVEHGDAVRQCHRLCLVVRDEDHGHAELAVQAADLQLHLLAQVLVERRQRFVHQHHPRLEHQRPRQRHALLLPARELLRLAFGEMGQLHLGQGRGHPLAYRRARPSCAPTAGRRRSAPPSSAGTASSSGTRHPCRAGAAAASRSAGHRGGWLPKSASRSRRAASASWSCPIPKVQAA